MMRRFLPALLLLAACDKDPDPGTDPHALRDADPPQLRLASAGDTFDLARQRGKVTVVFFGYTRCPDICPLTMQDFAAVKQRLGPRADSVRFVFVSVDPARDTPQSAEAWVDRFDTAFVGLAGDSAAIARARRAFHVWAEADSGAAADYRVTHTATVHIVGTDGRWNDVLMFGDERAELLYAAVVRALD